MERVCAQSECGKPFTPKTHNQRYCGDECCRIATNKRIMEKYYKKKDRRKGGVRVCASPSCGTKLSRYNDLELCAMCSTKSVQSLKDKMMKDLLRVSG